MSLDDSSFQSNILRYGKVASAVASLATRIAGEKYLGLKIERESHSKEIKEILGSLRGPLMKIGQILATIPEALPPEYASELQQLQSKAPPMGWSFVRRRMKAELGEDWQKKFSSFDREASAAASLGQVHKAVTHDGRNIACKLQYPDMMSAVEADLNQLRFALSLFEKYDSSLKTDKVQEELTERFLEELDYYKEADNTKMFGQMLSDYQGVNVPNVVDELSTKRLLTSEWLDGKEFLTVANLPEEEKSSIAKHLFNVWYLPFYKYGVIHGDPHPGNYTYDSSQRINLLDFGCIRKFRPEFVGGVIDLYHAVEKDDRDLAVHAYETWGFTGLNNPQIDSLNLWAKFLYDSLLDDRERVIGESNGGIYGREIAMEVHKRLRESGTVNIPKEFVFMDRAALGMGSVFIKIQAKLNWHQMFNELIEDFSEQKVQENQNRL